MMNELVGAECTVEFDLPHTAWPIEGFPAWVNVLAVDMPMVKMASIHAGQPIWVNAKIIKTIRATGRGQY